MHLLPHGQIRVLAVGLQIAFARLSRLPAADSQASRDLTCRCDWSRRTMIMNVKAHGESPDLPAGVMATRSAISARAYSGLTSAQPQVRAACEPRADPDATCRLRRAAACGRTRS